MSFLMSNIHLRLYSRNSDRNIARGRYTTRRRENTTLYLNRNFNPQSHPPRNLRLRNRIGFYLDENGRTRRLNPQFIPEQPQQRPVRTDAELTEHTELLTAHLGELVVEIDTYIDSAFRSSRKNEVYVFMKGEYVLMNYAPGSTGDRIINGPQYIGYGFRSLIGTVFGEYGIDASFGSHVKDEAIIFSGNLCARINFAPGSTEDKIIGGVKTITQMFPFFKGTNFENGVDAAFESTSAGEAYLFKGSEYALINYAKPAFIAIRPIVDGFECLRHTEFERDIGAAFASHSFKQAYLFKGNRYILLYFTPGKKKDYIIGGPKEIVPSNWPSLRDILPRQDESLDYYDIPANPQPADRDRDEL